MYAVVKNVEGNFVIDASGEELLDAIEICSRITDESHAGEVYVVSDKKAETLSGKSTLDVESFVAFDIEGLPFKVRRASRVSE